MKKILSALMSMTVAFCAMPVISNAEDTENPDIILSNALPCYVDGKTAVFRGGDNFDNYDFVTVTAPEKKFTTERNENTFSFTPEQDGTYLVSMVWIEETPLICYDLMPDIISPASYYFYPHICNFEITYTSETGTKIKLIGERTFYNENTIEKIKTNPSMLRHDYTEMTTDDIFNDGGYYALATRVSPTPFIYFDYGDKSKEDKSVFCIKNEWAWDDADGAITVTGNAKKTDTFCGVSFITGDLMDGTENTSFYTLIEPIGDGLAEVYYDPNYNSPYDVYIPPVSIMLTIENGQFIPDIMTIGDDFMSGDMNFDYEINIADAVLLQKYILGKTNFTSMQYACADMNFDGIVDIFDMVLIRQEIFGSQGIIVEPIYTIK